MEKNVKKKKARPSIYNLIDRLAIKRHIEKEKDKHPGHIMFI